MVNNNRITSKIRYIDGVQPTSPRMLLVLLPVIITLIFVSRSEKLRPIIEKTPQSLLIMPKVLDY